MILKSRAYLTLVSAEAVVVRDLLMMLFQVQNLWIFTTSKTTFNNDSRAVLIFHFFFQFEYFKNFNFGKFDFFQIWFFENWKIMTIQITKYQ